MKRAVIFSNGDLADVSQIKEMIKPSDFIIAANGGSKHCKTLGIVPDLVLGDLDSLSKKLKQEWERRNVAIISYPEDKDWTDTELALKYAIKEDFKEIVLAGFLGKRVDQVISNLLMMVGVVDKVDKLMIIEGQQRIYVVKDRLEIKGKKGDLVSLIPLLKDCQGVMTKGLKYQLQGSTLKFGKSRGVSNVMLGKKAEIGVKKGKLLVVYNRG